MSFSRRTFHRTVADGVDCIYGLHCRRITSFSKTLRATIWRCGQRLSRFPLQLRKKSLHPRSNSTKASQVPSRSYGFQFKLPGDLSSARSHNFEGRRSMRTNGIGWITGLVLVVATSVAAFAAGWGGRVAQPPQVKDEYRLEGPFTHGNLSVFLIHGQDRIKGQTFITLQEALIQKKVIVRETREVNELSIENVSGEEVYVQSGDIVKGGQQDRMMAVDLILPPRS